MAGKCSICYHSNRDEIDKLLVSGVSLRNISEQFGDISPTALHRHKTEHIPELLAKSEGAKLIQSENLLEHLNQLQETTMELLSEAQDSGDVRTALQAIGQARNNIELYAKISGDLEQRISVKTQNDSTETDRELIQAYINDPEFSKLACRAIELSSKLKSKHASGCKDGNNSLLLTVNPT